MNYSYEEYLSCLKQYHWAITLITKSSHMSFLVNNNIDRAYIARVDQETRILKSSKLDWDIQEVTRFASLIKVDESLASIIQNQGIDGQTLFNINFLASQLELATDETKFLPISKLFFIANAIIDINRHSNGSLEQSHQNAFVIHNNDNIFCSEQSIDVEEQILQGLRGELQNLNNIPVIELSSTQVYKMARNICLMKMLDIAEEKVELIRKWTIDGFCLVCIIPYQQQNTIIRNYYSDQDINFLKSLSIYFLHLYYIQYWQTAKREVTSSFKSNRTDKLDQFNIDFLDVHMMEGYGVKKSLGQSEYDVEESRGSVMGESVRGSAVRESVYGTSERGSLQMSEYGVSERGSLRQSLAGSVYASSEIMEDEQMGTTFNKSKQREAIGSSISDDNTEVLIAASLKLPFNLLNLEPLQKIRISTMIYPFPSKGGLNPMTKKQSSNSNSHSSSPYIETDASTVKTQSIYDWISENEQITQSKNFNLAGAKFGRSPENDFSYPDELSISGKHAQIVFRDESYFLRDLGSKTGTFLYISQQKPLILADQQLIQLSYEVQIKVVILKNDVNEGVIKFEFKKPDNEPPYRAILKNNNTVRIGKAEKSHIRLLNQSISSYHAEIKYEQGKFIMYDCNTRTGTWLRLSSKGVRSADRKLTKNDIFRISSKKTFYVEEITEHIHYENSCPFSSMYYF